MASGYEASRPVRIGNAAHTQMQLDVYGELMDALYQARRGGVDENSRAWAIQCALLHHLAAIWQSRRRHLGDPRRSAAVYLFENHGLGCVRPGHQERNRVRHERADRSMGEDSRSDSRGRVPPGL